MNDTASLELCKALYELSGWYGTNLSWYRHYDDVSITWVSFIDGANGVFVCPAYDLSYLVRKFASKGGIDIRYGDKGCIASSHMHTIETDTPEDAACTLAIELFREGILKT